MRQLEFLFTEDGARQLYIEHQLADMRSKWIQIQEPRPDLKVYRVLYVEAGFAKQFSDTWRDFYYGNIVENQTKEAIYKYQEKPL